MSPAKTAGTVTDRLTVARNDEEAAKERVNHAEAALQAAIKDEDYSSAEKAKEELEAARDALVIASAHADALQAGASALAQKRAAEQQAQALLEARKLADDNYRRCREQEAEALDEVQQHLADVEPAYEALRRVMQAALDAEHRLGNIRNEVHMYAQAAGHTDPALPAPPRPNRARTRFAQSQILTQVLQTRVTH